MNYPKEGIVVMLVEDSEKERNKFIGLLHSSGIQVKSIVTACNFEEANTTAFSTHPDIIFSSVILNGATRQPISRQIASTPLITLSDETNEDIQQHSILMGADDHLFCNELSGPVLKKAVQYSFERKKKNEHLREAIQRFRMIGKATNDIAWDWEFDKKSAQWMGNGIKNIMKVPATEMVVEMDFWENHLHPEDKDRVLNKLNGIFEKADTDKWEDEYRLMNQEGEYRYIFDRGFIVYKNNIPVRMVGIMEDITAKVVLEKKLEVEKLLKQKHISEAVITAQEKERTEIGKELHDNVNQLLSASRLYIDAANTDQTNATFLLTQASSFIKNAIEEIRTLSKVLHTPLISELGLKDSIDNLAEEIMAVSPLKITITTTGFHEADLNDNFKLTLYRIMQEQLTNILKHAKASSAEICLKSDDQYVSLEISDNGIGFDTTKKRQGIGISNIHSRAVMYNGTMKLNSVPQQGSSLHVRFPVDEMLNIKMFGNTDTYQ